MNKNQNDRLQRLLDATPAGPLDGVAGWDEMPAAGSEWPAQDWDKQLDHTAAGNAVTIQAMKEARRGGLKSFVTVDDLMVDLNCPRRTSSQER